MTISLLNNLQQLFHTNEWPKILSTTLIDSGYLLDLYIDKNIHWLQGHFPEQALVAGVVQTHWATRFAQTIFSIENHFHQINNLKFQDVILPEQQVQLRLEFNADKNSITFCYHRKTEQTDQTEIVFSEGKINFLINDLAEGPV